MREGAARGLIPTGLRLVSRSPTVNSPDGAVLSPCRPWPGPAVAAMGSLSSIGGEVQGEGESNLFFRFAEHQVVEATPNLTGLPKLAKI